jgi:tetratricopeptide (TPR) repeat protein
MPGPDPHHPKVFISYSHDSLEHSDRVRELSDRLREDGIDCILDQYEVSPPEGWPLWMDKQIRDADFVLMICTETYYRRVMREETPGTGLGVRWEGNLIYQHIYNPGTLNAKFIPVLFDSGKVEYIPTPLQGVDRYAAQTEEGYEDLYRRLSNQPKYLKPKLGEVRKVGELQKLQPVVPKERKQDFFAASLTNLPFERNPFFTGRDQILMDLHDAFSIKSAGSTTQAISGFGGLGKSQIAIEYAYRHRDEYTAVFWVRADAQLALSTGFVEIARLLDLPEKDAQKPDDAVRAVIRWLEDNSGWLLIFDNADMPELLKGFRPRNADGHVLLTSRAQVFDTLGIAKPFEIDVMLPEEALKFLFTRTGRDDDNAAEKEAARQLAEELGYLPLALEQAGAFITAKQARFQDYLVGYQKRRLELLKESRPVAGEYPESVATTWAINFSEIEKASAAASDLLRTSAFLSPDRIPLELMTKGKSELGPAVSAALADADDDPLALNEVLEPLTRYSFIRLDSDSQTYNIHRLVQEVLRDGMDVDTQRLWAERLVRALNQAFPGVEFKNWPLCERLLPHAKVGAKLIEKWNITFVEAAILLNLAGFYSKVRGQYADAELLYRRSLAILEKTLEADDPDVALSLNNLGELYRAKGKYTEAEKLLKRSLTIREKVLGPDHPDTAQSLNNLALLYHGQDKYTKAEPLFKRSLAIYEATLEPDSPSVAGGLNNLAFLYYAQGKYTEAEPLLKRSLAIREGALGPDHPDVAQSLNNLAELYRESGKYDKAEPLYKQSLPILEKALGPDHPNVAVTLNNLALLYKSQSKPAEAEPLYKRSLAIREKALGPDHPAVATALENLAVLLRETQRDAEAEKLEARAEAIRAKYAQDDSAE